MSSNCLISFFACCNNRKRVIAPSDSSTYTNFLQNVGTQTNIFTSNYSLITGSLPALKPTAKISHKPIIMIKESPSFHGRSSDEFKRQREKKLSMSPSMSSQNRSGKKRENYSQDFISMPFVLNKGKNMPKVLPVTPSNIPKTRFPNIYKSARQVIDEEVERFEEESDSLVNM